jgi:holin-like protein
MLPAFAVLLAFQLAGECLARVLPMGIPGPVIGLCLLAIACLASHRLRDFTEQAARPIIGTLSLLFLPAAVGVVQFLPVLERDGIAIAAAILISTFLTLVVTALVFRFVVRRMHLEERE